MKTLKLLTCFNIAASIYGLLIWFYLLLSHAIILQFIWMQIFVTFGFVICLIAAVRFWIKEQDYFSEWGYNLDEARKLLNEVTRIHNSQNKILKELELYQKEIQTKRTEKTN